MKYSFRLLISLFLSQTAFGCSDPPKAYFYSPAELVANADGIYMAKVVSLVEIENEYAKHLPAAFSEVILEVNEVLKGDVSRKTVEMKGYNLNAEEKYNAGNHEVKEFWDRPMVGSGVAPGDCWAYGVYEVGATYLLFTDIGHIKAFEPINDKERDKWYAKIRELAVGIN